MRSLTSFVGCEYNSLLATRTQILTQILRVRRATQKSLHILLLGWLAKDLQEEEKKRPIQHL